YELYAIAAAVLGGCSLRGGSGSIVGVVVGTAVMRALYLSIEALSIPKPYEFVIIGLALLIAVLADELILRLVQARKMRAQSKMV
ncbi:MAG: Ribose transport system permease protein RbsC, partial [Planctomycetota bacterium]